MRCSTQQHPFYCGLDLHARTMDVCILSQDGEVVLHRHMQASPDALLKAMAPYRDARVIAVACLFTWYWRAALGAPGRAAFCPGPRPVYASDPWGQAKNDPIDSQQIAVRLRGGLLPQAAVSPAALRATRDVLRRRTPVMRERAEFLAHIHKTKSQYPLPAMGKKIASKAQRRGGAERFPGPRCRRASQATSRCWATTTSGAATWSCPSSQRPSSLRPRRCPCLTPVFDRATQLQLLALRGCDGSCEQDGWVSQCAAEPPRLHRYLGCTTANGHVLHA